MRSGLRPATAAGWRTAPPARGSDLPGWPPAAFCRIANPGQGAAGETRPHCRATRRRRTGGLMHPHAAPGSALSLVVVTSLVLGACATTRAPVVETPPADSPPIALPVDGRAGAV